MPKFSTPTTFADLLSGACDPLGLLSNVKPAAPKAKPRSVVEVNFQEIIEFFEKHQRVPDLNAADFREKQLAARLTSYRTRNELKKQVEQLDTVGLLKEAVPSIPQNQEQPPNKSFSSLADILQNDTSGLLGNIDSSIFNLEHVNTAEPDMRNLPAEIASRKPCEDFFKFEKLFQDTQRDILNRKTKTARFKNETQIEIGEFFILNGLLCIVDSIIEESGTQYVRDNPRLRVVFENGIETNILKRSLSRALYKDPNGRRVLLSEEAFYEKAQGITHKDKATGCIYVLASETKSPVLADLKHQGRLVKIGYSTQSVEERIKGAEDDPTYLEAPVRILAVLDCYNLNPQKVEHLIHAFLSKQRINMTLISSKGKPYRPTEWFAVDRETAVAVAEHIVAGDIMNYRMDNTTGRIKKTD